MIFCDFWGLLLRGFGNSPEFAAHPAQILDFPSFIVCCSAAAAWSNSLQSCCRRDCGIVVVSWAPILPRLPLQVAQAALKNAERRHSLLKQAQQASLLEAAASGSQDAKDGKQKAAGTPVKPTATKPASSPPAPTQPGQVNKRVREKTTPNTHAQQTPSTKTPDCKHLRAEEFQTPKKQLFEGAWAAFSYTWTIYIYAYIYTLLLLLLYIYIIIIIYIKYICIIALNHPAGGPARALSAESLSGTTLALGATPCDIKQALA